MKNSNMHASLLGSPDAGTATVTLPDGTTFDIPSDSVGDLFGDASDDDDESYAGLSGIGDPTITNLGDLMVGDTLMGGPKKKKATFGAAASALPTSPNLSAANRKASAASKATVDVLKSIPGAILSAKSLSPLMISKGMLNITPTRAMIQGASIIETFRRYETQYTGTTRTQVNVAASGNVTFTFAAPTVAEGGNTLFCPAVLVQLGAQRQFAVPNAEIRISLTGNDESGNALDARQWSVLVPDGLDSLFLAFVPFREAASTVYPAIARANVGATFQLVVNLFALPNNTNVRVAFPGPDSAQYQYLKRLLGIAPQTETLLNTAGQ
jgi:hypothetical protein